MSTWVWIVIAVVAVIVVAGIVWSAQKSRRRRQLQEGFGPEYEHAVEATGNRRAAERELQERQERRQSLDIRELSPATRDRYSESWRTVQTRFVDDPGGAVREADGLVQSVMRDRGYPTDDFEQRAADVSVDHPHVVEHYRAAHRVWAANERGQATTEDLRQSLVHYRSLFDELLGTGAATGADAPIARDTTQQDERNIAAEEAGAETRR
jgi:hypothetical protein